MGKIGTVIINYFKLVHKKLRKSANGHIFNRDGGGGGCGGLLIFLNFNFSFLKRHLRFITEIV